MTDTSANWFLYFSNTYVVIFLAFCGFFLISRVIFFQATVMGAVDIVTNVMLKGVFKVPLSASLHKIGYAFPSGHMQFSTVFYVWLMIYCRLWYVRLAITMLLIGIGAGLIHFNYHNWHDVVAGAAVGVGLVSIFWYGLYRYDKMACFAVIFWSSISMLLNYYLYHHIPVHAFAAYGLLLSVIIIERFFSVNGNKNTYWKVAHCLS